MSTFADSGLCAPPHKVFAVREDVKFASGAALIYGGFEDRTQLPKEWLAQFGSPDVHRINEQDEFGQITIDGLPNRVFSLRQSTPLREWVGSLGCSMIYLDITGLSHGVWMPLVRIVLESGKGIMCLYTEPGRYTPSANPRPGEFYDLSERVMGFRPIPSLAKLPSRSRSQALLIPLLGFEGVRLKYLIETVEPNDRDIFPIIGVPGFEIDYPFHTYEGNADALKVTRAWQRVDFVDASCPFSLLKWFETLRIAAPDKFFKIATIGTKPHALGALLFALRDASSEILYDHPVKKMGRTQGVGKCHLYDVTRYWEVGH
ncbi:hypothetical protein WA845_23300 [Agrobacterium sp. CMT1]|uniref:hypothetical protein n=1 Tax=Agrobacterium sp. CMT1 TaxID=3128901 RepID=UPI003077A71F